MRILILDDYEYLAKALARQLATYGDQTIFVISTAEAFRWLDRVDAVITDLNMPSMDGIAFAEQARKRRPDLPIAFYTAEPASELAQRAKSFGPVMGKPWSPEDILLVLMALKTPPIGSTPPA